MHRKFDLPDLFLVISLGMIAIEAALSRVSVIRARYRVSDTFASLGMQIGNIAKNLMMTGIVFAGLTAVYKLRLFTISPTIGSIGSAMSVGSGGRGTSITTPHENIIYRQPCASPGPV